MPKTVLLSGVCGSGKTAITQLGYERLREALGATASIDTDRLFIMIDPDWALPYDSARAELVYRQVGLLAVSFFDFGLDTVLVVGNALHTPEISIWFYRRCWSAARCFTSRSTRA